MIIIPKDKDKANTHMYRFAKLFQQKMQNAHHHSRKHEKNQFMQSIKFNPPPTGKKTQGNPAVPRKKTPYCK